MLSSVFKITDLQQRREPKKETAQIIQIRSKTEVVVEGEDTPPEKEIE
jgi:hypothetical protein